MYKVNYFWDNYLTSILWSIYFTIIFTWYDVIDKRKQKLKDIKNCNIKICHYIFYGIIPIWWRVEICELQDELSKYPM